MRLTHRVVDRAGVCSVGEGFMALISLMLAAATSVGLLVSGGQTCTPVATQVQGSVLYCCTLSSGQRCCSEGRAPDGKVLGCGC